MIYENENNNQNEEIESKKKKRHTRCIAKPFKRKTSTSIILILNKVGKCYCFEKTHFAIRWLTCCSSSSFSSGFFGCFLLDSHFSASLYGCPLYWVTHWIFDYYAPCGTELKYRHWKFRTLWQIQVCVVRSSSSSTFKMKRKNERKSAKYLITEHRNEASCTFLMEHYIHAKWYLYRTNRNPQCVQTNK